MCIVLCDLLKATIKFPKETVMLLFGFFLNNKIRRFCLKTQKVKSVQNPQQEKKEISSSEEEKEYPVRTFEPVKPKEKRVSIKDSIKEMTVADLVKQQKKRRAEL